MTDRSRRQFCARLGAAAGALAGAIVPLPAAARWAEVHELTGTVFVNGRPATRQSGIQPGQTLATGADGRVWFTLAGDAYFLRPGSELRLRGAPGDLFIDSLRLVTGALGATFRPGARRTVVASTATIGIRGTGVYVESSPTETYACTCFGSTDLYANPGGAMMDSLRVDTAHHLARRIVADALSGMRLIPARFERHTSEEMARLERLAGRPNPF